MLNFAPFSFVVESKGEKEYEKLFDSGWCRSCPGKTVWNRGCSCVGGRCGDAGYYFWDYGGGGELS